jgi:hypothetical protein
MGLNYDRTNYDRNVKAQAQEKRDRLTATKVESEFRDKRVAMKERHEKEQRAEKQKQEFAVSQEHRRLGIPRDTPLHKTFRDKLNADWKKMEDKQSEERHALIKEHDKAAQKAREADEKASRTESQRTKPPVMNQW